MEEEAEEEEASPTRCRVMVTAGTVWDGSSGSDECCSAVPGITMPSSTPTASI